MTLQLIEINLSEEFSRRKRKTRSGMPQVKLPRWFGVAVVLVVFAFTGFHMMVKTRQATGRKLAQQVSAFTVSNTIANKLIDDQSRLNERILTLLSWHTNRLTYAKVWHRISKIVPDNIYFSDIKLAKTDSAGDHVMFALVGRGRAGADIVGFVTKIKADQILNDVFDKIELSKDINTEGAETIFTINMTRTIVMTRTGVAPRMTVIAGGKTP